MFLSEQEASLLKGRVQLIEVPAESVLGLEGDLENCVYFIATGKLKVYRHTGDADFNSQVSFTNIQLPYFIMLVGGLVCSMKDPGAKSTCSMHVSCTHACSCSCQYIVVLHDSHGHTHTHTHTH